MESPAVRMDTFTTGDGVEYTLTDYGHTVSYEAIIPCRKSDSCDDDRHMTLLSSISLPRHVALRFASGLLLERDVTADIISLPDEIDEWQPELPFVDPPWNRDTPPQE